MSREGRRIGRPRRAAPTRDAHTEADPPPPLLGSWRNLYLFVLTELAVLVLGFYLLSRWAS